MASFDVVGDRGEVPSVLDSVAVSSCHRHSLFSEYLRQREENSVVPDESGVWSQS